MSTATATELDSLPTLGSATVAAIEAAWAAIAERHPELPRRIVVITGSGAVSGGLIRGHWHPSRWHHADDVLPEVFVSGERIADGALGVMTTLVHEAVHGLAAARGIKDTSRQNRYHNKRFKALAEEMGMVPPAAPDLTLGFSNCVLADETVVEYAEAIEGLEAALGASIPMITLETLTAWWIVWRLFQGALMCWPGMGLDPVVAPAGVRVVKPRAPRRPRPKVALVCECREVVVDPAVAEALHDVSCDSCGKPLAHEAR